MTGSADARASHGPARPVTLVWIDSRHATVVRWPDGAGSMERLESDVPAHHRSTGHIRHDPGIRSGGGGPPQTAGEPNRLEHLNRFLDLVAARLAPTDDLLILGPGTVHEHLAGLIRSDDARQRLVREVRCEAAPSLTPRQLVARLRRAAGAEPPRRTAGPHSAHHPH